MCWMDEQILTHLSISPRSEPISTLIMSSAYWSSMFSLIWLFSSMENILSHLLRSGEPQGGGLDVAADRQSGGGFPFVYLNNIEENSDPTRFCPTCGALQERAMITARRMFYQPQKCFCHIATIHPKVVWLMGPLWCPRLTAGKETLPWGAFVANTVSWLTWLVTIDAFTLRSGFLRWFYFIFSYFRAFSCLKTQVLNFFMKCMILEGVQFYID